MFSEALGKTNGPWVPDRGGEGRARQPERVLGEPREAAVSTPEMPGERRACRSRNSVIYLYWDSCFLVLWGSSLCGRDPWPWPQTGHTAQPHHASTLNRVPLTGCSRGGEVNSDSSNASDPSSPSLQSLEEVGLVARPGWRERDLSLWPQESIMVSSQSGIF